MPKKMPKKLYMLTRRHPKPCTHLGVRHLPAVGNLPPRTERVTVSFVPGRVVQVDGDLDMRGAIEAGFIVEVKPIVAEPKPVPKPVVKFDPKPEPEPVVEEPRDKPMDVHVGVMTATVDPGPDGELNTEDDEITIVPTKAEEPEKEPGAVEEPKATPRRRRKKPGKTK